MLHNGPLGIRQFQLRHIARALCDCPARICRLSLRSSTADLYSYDALPLGLMSRLARGQILRVRLEQHRAEIAIIRRRYGSGKLCVFVFHIGACQNETFTSAFCTVRADAINVRAHFPDNFADNR